MNTRSTKLLGLSLALAVCLVALARAQTPANPPRPEGQPPAGGPPNFDGPPPFGPGRGGFGPGRGGVQPERKLVSQFDKDADKRLNAEERQAAREFVRQNPSGRGPGGGRRGGRGGEFQEPAQPGRKLTPADVKSYGDAPVYDPSSLRTFFLEFESADWETELADFNNTDVEVPAKLTVDGKTLKDVGVHFRGASSFFMVPEGRKRSLNLAIDFAHEDQTLGGYRTFNLLNSNGDPSFLRTVLYLDIAREYIPAPKANFVRVVINGESWGIYTSQQQYNKEMVKDLFGSTKGARWKVPGSPGGRAGLEYLGEDVASYKRLYEIKTKDEPPVWADFIKLCRVLNETPAEQLEKALEPLLDVDGALKFLALEVALVNSDGYWVRSSDYSIYQDEKRRFHILPHDANEAFSTGGGPGGGRGGRGGDFGGGPGFEGRPSGPGPGGGPGGPPPEGGFAGEPGQGRGPGFGGGRGGGPGGGGLELDPLVGLNDTSKPLRSKLLAVPALRARYLGYVRDIAEKSLDWNKLGPIAKQYHALIAEDVKLDTRKLSTTEAFLNGLDTDAPAQAQAGPGGGRGGPRMSLKRFAESRRTFLLNHPEIKNAGN